jgi:hypothetical protein
MSLYVIETTRDGIVRSLISEGANAAQAVQKLVDILYAFDEDVKFCAAHGEDGRDADAFTVFTSSAAAHVVRRVTESEGKHV